MYLHDRNCLRLSLSLYLHMYACMFHTLSVCGSSCSDFSFLAERVPGVSFSIGTKHPDHAKGEGTGVQAHNSLFLTSTRGHCHEDPPFWPRSRWNSLRSRSPRRPMVSCERQTPIRHTHTSSLSFDLPLSCLELFFLHLSVLTLR